jgi:hypothetical protein
MSNKVRKRKRPCASGQERCCLAEETLEAYLLGRLPGQQQQAADDPEVGLVEEHLLWCEACQKKAEAEEKEITALRAALAAYPPVAQVSPSGGSRRKRLLHNEESIVCKPSATNVRSKAMGLIVG